MSKKDEFVTDEEQNEEIKDELNEEPEEEMEEENEDEERSSFSPIKIVLLTLSIILLLGASVAGAGGYYVYTNLQVADPEAQEPVRVEIPMGSSVSSIASILESKGIIKNDQIFYYYVRYKGESGFQAGEYYLTASMEHDQIIEKLKQGTVHLETEQFTIAEGLSIEQIATHLEQNGLVNKEKFLTLVNEGDFSDISFVSSIPEVQDRKYRLEGFLFPETYEIFAGADEEEIIRTMLEQFEKEVSDEWQAELEKRGVSLYDAITLASIVEREAVLDKERKTISGVFYNRLEEGWMLQSCATVQFVLGKQRDRLLYEDLEVDSPYNTYINEGLPPSPIASPGRSSIEAAIFPESHEYFFFLTKKDGTGSHHFAKTFSEHQKNNAQSRGNF